MNSGISTDRLVPNEQASFTELLDNQEGIILDLGNLHYYTLNATGVYLWKQLRREEAHTSDTLSEGLAVAFSIDRAQAERDTEAFLTDLRQYGLITDQPLAGIDRALPAAAASATELPAYAAPQLCLASSLMTVTLSGSTTVASAAVGGS